MKSRDATPEASAPPPDCTARHALQRKFFARMGVAQQFRRLFEHLPGVYFFVKDDRSRLISVSQPLLEHIGVTDELQVIGTTDYDYFPPQLAEGFVRDDQLVMRTGQPLLNRVEIWYTEQQLLDWFITNKLPISDVSGRIIGVMGTVQSYEGKRKFLLPFSEIREAVDYVRAHHRERISVDHLAERTGLSARQLHRKFREVFGMSVQDFLMKTRIQAASDALLNTEASIANIAIDFGFYDQCAFTRQFHRHMGLTPLKFRKRHSPAH